MVRLRNKWIGKNMGRKKTEIGRRKRRNDKKKIPKGREEK